MKLGLGGILYRVDKEKLVLAILGAHFKLQAYEVAAKRQATAATDEPMFAEYHRGRADAFNSAMVMLDHVLEQVCGDELNEDDYS